MSGTENEHAGEHGGAPVWGYAAPEAPFAVAPRIPTRDPFVLRPSMWRLALLYGPFFLAIAGLSATQLLLLVQVDLSDHDKASLVCVVVAMSANVGLPVALWWMAAAGGPWLAVGPHGLWVRARKFPVKAIWLPWEAIERIYLRRWMVAKVLCIRSRYPNVTAGLGVTVSLDVAMSRGLVGAEFTAAMRFGNRRESEVMAALRHWSAGRVPILDGPVPR